MSDTLTCWNCATALHEVLLPVSRHEYCPQCAEAVHCCRMCRHYAPRLAEQCAEDRAEPPTDRQSANFCEFFLPLLPSDGESGTDGAAAAARARLDALFGDDDTVP